MKGTLVRRFDKGPLVTRKTYHKKCNPGEIYGTGFGADCGLG
jgi:hypothetical protein